MRLDIGHWTWAILLCLTAATACQEKISAPGACPDFCPPGSIDVRDTVLSNVTIADSFFVGYRLAHEAEQLQVADPAGEVESRAVIVFSRFAATYTGADTSVSRTIQQTDSFRVRLYVLRRNVGLPDAAVVLYRVPVTVDSTTTLADLAPYFANRTEIGSTAMADTFRTGPITITVPAASLPNYVGDSLRIAVGIRVRASSPAFLSLPSRDVNVIDTIGARNVARVTRFVQLDSGSVRVTRTDSTFSVFDTFVLNDSGTAESGMLRIGGVPAARALLQTDTSRSGALTRIVDSTQAIRATLLLVPARPVQGAPQDTFRLFAQFMGADLGPKSPSDTIVAGVTRVAVGSADTVRIDVTSVLQTWRANPDVPRAFMLRADPEAATLGTLQLRARSSGGGAALHLTYVRRFR